MSTKRKFFFIFLFVLLNMFLLVSFLVIRDATRLNNLKKEVNSLSKLDVTKDRYNLKIKTSGKYGVVEKAIKKYLDEYAVLLQDTLQIVKDPKLTSILSYENYKNDGPEFTKSLTYLNEKKSSFDKNMETLLNNLDEEVIKKYIYEYTEDEYFVQLYNELMFTNSMKDDFSETKSLLERTKTKVDNVLETSSAVLTFLVQQKGFWVLEEGEIRFQTNELYNQYMAYIQDIQS